MQILENLSNSSCQLCQENVTTKYFPETRLLRDLSSSFVRNYVSHFVKNIQKVFLATIIGVPFVQSCAMLNDKYGSDLGQGQVNPGAILTEKEETELDKMSGSVSVKTGDEEEGEGVRRTSVTTFYSFKGNEVYHELDDEIIGTDDSAASAQYRSV